MTAFRYRDTMLALLGLLLLVCLPCAVARGDEDSNNDIPQQLEHGAARTRAPPDSQVNSHGDQAASTFIQQPACLADIHAVLRDMTALMTEQRIELRHTQQELKAAMERLTESERLMKAALETIEVRSNATEQDVQLLQKQNEVKQVAFSASLLASGSGHTGPYNVQTILIYRHVISNVGNGYNPNTGFFTARVRGIYQFSFFLHGGGASHGSGAVLVKNGQPVVIAWAHQTSYSVNPSNGASLLLEAGDVVYVKLWQNAWIYDSQNHHSTFSGHLLFTV